MPHANDDLLSLIAQLRVLAQAPRGDDAAFPRIVAITEWIERTARLPTIASKAVEVRFKAEDVFVREQSMPEAVLREMLAARLNSLAAEMRAAAPVIPITFDRRRP